VLEELQRERPDLHVLVVSDGSSDATARVARAAGVAVVELPFNLGIGGALRTGFRFAVEHGYQAAVQFDADGQHDPRAVATITAPLADGADLVIGSRFAEGGAPTYEVGRSRRLAMRGLERVVRLLVGRRFTDTSSGFRAFSRRMLVYFAQHYPVEYMDSVEALVLADNAGFDVREVPANMRGRTGGAPSTRSWRLGYYYARLLVVLLTSYTRPARRAERVRPRVSPSPREQEA
jgi:glycosyltransferase involved in cell wall biosynthesis